MAAGVSKTLWDVEDIVKVIMDRFSQNMYKIGVIGCDTVKFCRP